MKALMVRRGRWTLGLVAVLTAAALVIGGACGGGGTDKEELAAVLHQVLSVGQPSDTRFDVVVGDTLEGFPQEFPFYTGADLVVTFRSQASDGTSYLAIFSTPDPVERVMDFYQEALAQAGPWEVRGVNLSGEGGAVQFADPANADFTGTVVVTKLPEREGVTSIGVSINLGAGRPRQDITPFQLSPSLRLPPGFPNDLPLYDGATVIATAWFRNEDGTTSYLIRLLTTDIEEDVIDFYRQILNAAGWQIDDDFQDERGFGLIFVDSFNQALGGTVLADVFPDDTKYTEVILQVNTESRRAN